MSSLVHGCHHGTSTVDAGRQVLDFVPYVTWCGDGLDNQSRDLPCQKHAAHDRLAPQRC